MPLPAPGRVWTDFSRRQAVGLALAGPFISSLEVVRRSAKSACRHRKGFQVRPQGARPCAELSRRCQRRTLDDLHGCEVLSQGKHNVLERPKDED
mmetsp:Transcript_30592/g.49192  ORF Transcript_30592/g.49192 Transcript_30592/m.49192 type:complete len:95 (-) Transcript_30592:209-493(-)